MTPVLLEEESATGAETAAVAPSAVASEAICRQGEENLPLHDRLAVGMAFLLVLTVAQRGVGFVRNLLFCRMLDPEELGRWNLAFAFLMLAAPLAVLGLPGSFGRYAEHFRKTGHLRSFLRRTGAASAVLALLAALTVAATPQRFAQWIFRDAGQVRLALAVGLTLSAVISFNFFTELFTALRRARIASIMQLIHSILFTAVGLGLLAVTSWGAGSVVLAYGAACAAACLGAASALRETWRAAPEPASPLRRLDFWAKLLPFAGWIWATNLLTNLSDVADRYMILYFAGGDAASSAALVGQYHSSRVVPDLLASVAAMLAAVLLPYNSHDWEAGDHAAVSRRVGLSIKFTGLTFTAAGAALLGAAPMLFGWVLEGKYELGREVLPWTLLLCIFFSLSVLALNYLWCAERAGQAMLAMGLGLACNLGLNLVLLPRWGLAGAVIATAAANAAALGCAYGFNHRLGMRLDAGVAAASFAPLSLLLGAAPAAATVIALAIFAVRGEWLLQADERSELVRSLRTFWTK